MPGVSQVVFVAEHLDRSGVESKSVLDVGSCNFNGSIKPYILSLKPEKCHGIDVISGRDVDQVLSATEIIQEFGKDSFDIIICLEMLEHAKDWKICVSNLKQALKPGGKLFLTTRSLGYPCHGFPNDFWRFSLDDFKDIFQDMEELTIQADPIEPGVFLAAKKPYNFAEKNILDTKIYCIMTGALEKEVPSDLTSSPYYIRLKMREKTKNIFHFFSRHLSKFASLFFGIRT